MVRHGQVERCVVRNGRFGKARCGVVVSSGVKIGGVW